MLATHPAHFSSFFYENPSIRTTETRFYEPERLSTPAKPCQTLVFTKTAGHHNQVQVVVILAGQRVSLCLVFPFIAGGHVTENQSKVYARWMLRIQHSTVGNTTFLRTAAGTLSLVR